jgi:hypothetical protein
VTHGSVSRHGKAFLSFQVPGGVKPGNHIPNLDIDTPEKFFGFPFPCGAYAAHHIGAVDALIVQGGKRTGRFAGIQVQKPEENRRGSYVQGKPGAAYGFPNGSIPGG